MLGTLTTLCVAIVAESQFKFCPNSGSCTSLYEVKNFNGTSMLRTLFLMICLLLQFPLEKSNVNLFQTDSTGATSWKKLLLKKLQLFFLFVIVSDLSNIFRFLLKLFYFYFLLCLGRQISQMVSSSTPLCLETGQLPAKNSNLSSLLMSNVKTQKRKGKTKKY